MNDKEKQDEGNWGEQMTEMKRLSQRAAKLSERGAHYFVGWLIGAGMHKPAMMAEFEKVLTRLENDPELSHCWREFGNLETPVAAASASAVVEAESSPALEPAFATEVQVVCTESLETNLEKSNTADEATAAPGSEEQEHEHARSGMVKFETTSNSETQERQGFFAKIFRKQRIAA